MKKLALLFTTFAIACSAQAQVPTALQLKLQDTLEDMRSKYNFKGLSAAVSYKGSGGWKSAVGVSEAGTPLSPGMLIGIGSNTKTFVAAAMMQLVEAGKVSLTDTIGTWLPDYENINGGITIRQILNHTSGINSYTDNAVTWDSVNKDLYRLWTKEEILRKFVEAPSFAPGTGWEYCNTNFIIAGMIEEKITGVPVHQLIRDSILAPNALLHTFFPPYETATDPYAHLWMDWDGDDVLDDVGEYATSAILPKEINSLADAAGALVSTAEDNVKFWEALMTGSIISKNALRNEFLKGSGFGIPGNDYGLGIMKYKYSGFPEVTFMHGGTWLGQINENLSDTVNNIYITVLSNQDSLKNGEVAQVVLALYKTLLNYKPTGIAEQPLAIASLQLYPNPASDRLYIGNLPAGNKNIRVLTAGGILVTAFESKSEAPFSIDLSGFAEGLYILQVSGEQEVAQSTFLVRH
jgi:D-alanyl-D-alanine carboxypeptidase